MPLKLGQQYNRGQVAADLAALFGQSFSRHTSRLDKARRMLIDQDFRLRREVLRVTRLTVTDAPDSRAYCNLIVAITGVLPVSTCIGFDLELKSP
jgi:hypothetical protein